MKKMIYSALLFSMIFGALPIALAAGLEDNALNDVVNTYNDLDAQWRSSRNKNLRMFRPAPEFRLQDTGQKYHNLSDYLNKNSLILFFWTTWCPYCRKEFSLLNDKYPQLLKEGVMLLAVNSGESIEAVSRFKERTKISFPVLLDKYLSVADVYEVLGVPTFVLINKSGNIVFQDNHFPDNYQNLLLE